MELRKLEYEARYFESNSGRSWGDYSIAEEYHELCDSEINDTDSSDEEDYVYSCPECSQSLEISDLLDEPIKEEDEEEDQEILLDTEDNFNLRYLKL